MQGQAYDKLAPDYKCAADRKLTGPLRESVVYTYLGIGTRTCTSAASAWIADTGGSRLQQAVCALVVMAVGATGR